MEVPLTLEMIEVAAKLTFGNVVLISLLCTVIDSMRRWFTVTRPVQRIADAAEKITEGDFSVHIQPVFSMGGQDGLNTIIHSFNRMAQELSGIETLRTDFISNVSHELKTPLAVIQNYGTMLQQPELPEELRQEYAKTVTDASRRLADLITNILKLNKLESQQIYPEKEVFDLGEQLCECLLAFEDIWEEKGMELDTDIAEDVAVRSSRMAEAFAHLTPTQARRIRARYMGGKKLREIGELEGTGESEAGHSVRSGIRRMRRYFIQQKWLNAQKED